VGRILATLATLLILVLGGAFIVPALIDWKQYRPLIEDTAAGILGRKVSILGDIDIVLLPEPHLRASNVAAGNSRADGAFMTADSVDLLLSLGGLLGGRIEAGNVRLVRPVLTVDFSKPLSSRGGAGEPDALPLSAGVTSLDIDRGRITVFSRGNATAEAFSLSGITGTVSASSPGGSYRFNGRLSRDGRPYDVKLAAALAPGLGIKLTGTAVDTASKLAVQADGLLSAVQDPSFEGSLALALPQQASGADRTPFDIQLKSAAKLSLANATFDDLALTIDSQNRPQVFLGSASLDLGAKTAALGLQARALDADALLTTTAGPGLPIGSAAPADWETLRTTADRLLWLYPDFGAQLSLEASQVQLRGEPVEDVKIHGSRAGQRWVFEQAQARLPGDTTIKLAGTVTKNGEASQLSASSLIEGKYPGRLGRWIAPAAWGSSRFSAGAFALRGSLTLSGDTAAFEGVTGSLDGTAFTASLRYETASARKLVVSLAGNDFDLGAFEAAGAEAGTLAPGSLKTASQTGLARIASFFGGDPGGFDVVEASISAGGIKTSAAVLKNVALNVKADREVITVSKLSAETASGLVLHGEGAVPLRGTGQGQFNGRIEARSPQAILQVAALAGYDASSPAGLRAANLSPASLSIVYGTEPGTGKATARLSGDAGPVHADGNAQLTGPLSDWKTGLLSAQANLTSSDGNKLLGLLFPSAVISPGASLSPGALAIRLNGTTDQLQTSTSLTAAPLQIQLDGAAGLIGQALTFKGNAVASSQTPEQFLPAPLLALLGGEPKANLRVASNIDFARGRVAAGELKAETPGNLVTGRLAIDAGGQVTRVDADLQASRYSLASFLSYFLADSPPEASALALPASPGAPLPPPDVWSGRPFLFSAFQDTAGRVSLTAKSMKLSEAVTLSDAQLLARLEKGRLDVEGLKGKALGGSLETSFSLTAKGNAVAGEGEMALAGADLSALPSPGTAPVITGQASLSLSAGGQGLSPRGLISVLRGRGDIRLSDGQLAKFSPSAVQKSAEEMLAQPLPLTEETITKRVLVAAQASDFNFRKLRIPVSIQDGMLEIRRASFRGREATVRMEAYLDLNKMQVDSTWQMGVSSDRRVRWPPVKIGLPGPLRELGARPRTLAADEFVRAILVRKMEGDLTRLEGLNKPSAAAQWTATQEPAKQGRRRKRNKETSGDGAEEPEAPAEAALPAPSPAPAPAQSFEKRMRDALDGHP
jgi:uncharacterized protein involved in outer membrane biogenesis